MSGLYVHKPYEVWSDDDESVLLTVRISCNAATRRQLLRDRKDTRDYFLEGHLYPTVCRCQHCLNDWDCCGRMIGWTPKLIPVKGGIKVEQHASRNV